MKKVVGVQHHTLGSGRIRILSQLWLTKASGLFTVPPTLGPGLKPLVHPYQIYQTKDN